MSFTSALTSLIRRIIRTETARIRTNTVCQVVEYDNATNLVRLQPCIQSVRTDDPNSPVKQLPQIGDIPVFQFGTGTLILTSAPAVGAYGLYIVSDRDTVNWLTQGGVVVPASSKMFDISNGFFLHGLFPLIVDGDNGKIDSGIETDRMSIRLRDGTAEISLDENGIVYLGENMPDTVWENAMHGDKFITKYNAHTHSTAFGPSGVPIVPWTTADNSTKVKIGT